MIQPGAASRKEPEGHRPGNDFVCSPVRLSNLSRPAPPPIGFIGHAVGHERSPPEAHQIASDAAGGESRVDSKLSQSGPHRASAFPGNGTQSKERRALMRSLAFPFVPIQRAIRSECLAHQARKPTVLISKGPTARPSTARCHHSESNCRSKQETRLQKQGVVPGAVFSNAAGSLLMLRTADRPAAS